MTIIAHSTRQGKIIHTLSLHDLGDTVASGERLRAFCPIHGGDHQRSLSIDSTSGWGFCHCCHATVLIQEMDTGGKKTCEGVGRIFHADHNRVFDPLSAPAHFPCYSSQTRSVPDSARWQHEEVAALTSLTSQLHAVMASSRRVQAYLDERGIPYAVAQASDLGYLSHSTWERAALSTEQRTLLARWIGRLIFPLHSPAGHGFIGRTLLKWEPGMNENAHKILLDQPGAPRRWIKTCPAGWSGFAEPAHLTEQVILVEGGFDRLALLAAGLPASMVVALVGTAARPSWFTHHAPQVRHIILALDADSGGLSATARLVKLFREAGLHVTHCSPPHDPWGKDWSERFRKLGPQSIWPLYEACSPDASSRDERR